MPATVKSLEERIDEMAEDFSSVKAQLRVIAGSQNSMQSQLTGLGNGLTTMQAQLTTMQTQFATMQGQFASSQAQLAVIVARLDLTIEESKATRTRMDTMVTDYTGFRSKAETSFAMVRWLGVFMAGVLVTVILSGFSVARSAGSLEATVQQQQKTLEDIRREVSELHGKQK